MKLVDAAEEVDESVDTGFAEAIESQNKCPEGQGFHIPGVKKCVPNGYEDMEETDVVVYRKKARTPMMYQDDWAYAESFDLKTAYNDKQACDHIAAASMIGTLLWVWSWLYYGKTTYEDKTMYPYGEPPLAWFWMNLASGTMGWTAASYLSYFWLYALISVVEFAAWCMYISGDKWFFELWSVVAKWGSLIAYTIPPIFAMLQLVLPATSGGLATTVSDGYINAVMLLIWGAINWLYQLIVHFIYVERLGNHIHAHDVVDDNEECRC